MCENYMSLRPLNKFNSSTDILNGNNIPTHLNWSIKTFTGMSWHPQCVAMTESNFWAQ